MYAKESFLSATNLIVNDGSEAETDKSIHSDYLQNLNCYLKKGKALYSQGKKKKEHKENAEVTKKVKVRKQAKRLFDVKPKSPKMFKNFDLS